ncbi:hypothetical protein AAFC00_005338 [Neodothiora populina]|uniref:Trafficking protein particle complex II-specific subunit 65 IgD3 domain-containing protein n=1 Tax=Neodothiora populina TaxID=2781224 RepID=A0ABR3PLN4_9PEZI
MPSLAASVQQPALTFPDDLRLELLILAQDDFNVASHVSKGPNALVTPRDTLFFEELLPVHVILRGNIDSDVFEDILSRTEVSVTANATSAAPPPRAHHGGNEVAEKPLRALLDSAALIGDDAVRGKSDSEDSPEYYAVFKAELYLKYPPAKLHKPAVHFNASVALHPAAKSNDSTPMESEYLMSGLPDTENLLGSLALSLGSITSPGEALSLPASRLTKVAPRASLTNVDARPLRISSKLIPITPMLMMRVASTASTPMSEPVATLDLELTRYVDCSVEIQSVKVKASHLSAECLTESLQSSLVLYPGDRSSLMYKLLEDDEWATANYADHALDIDVVAIARLTGSCNPRLKGQWRGTIDPFVGKRLNHWQRPGSSSSRMSQDMVASRPLGKHLSMTGRPQSTLGSDLGVTFSFSGPPNVRNGETFFLDIFIVNRSMRRKRLAIIAVPHPAKSLQSSTYGPRPFTADSNISTWRHETAEAVVQSKSLFYQHNRRQNDGAEVICLNADVRIGPLPPGTCHNVQLEFLALSPGFVSLAALHIIDLETKETIEVTDLPEIEVLDSGKDMLQI